jgi:multimeric flavodoxin WrbA
MITGNYTLLENNACLFGGNTMELEQFPEMIKARDSIAKEREKKGLGEKLVSSDTRKKKIIGLSCGSKNGNCELYLNAAAMGASELGVETEIIRASEMKVKPCEGCASCTRALVKGKMAKCPVKNDDVEWILHKTVVEDYGLIVSVPVYYIRSNSILMSICERMHPTMFNNLEILKKRKVGGIISVGGGLDGWASLGLVSVNIWVQHHRTVVDQVQIEMRDRTIDWMERARQLGRNVAGAIDMPIEEVKYLGEKSTLACPVCHCDIMQVPDYQPHDPKPKEFRYKQGDIVCPVCWVHGKLSFDNNKPAVKWDEWDITHSRLSEYGVYEHLDMLIRMIKEHKDGTEPINILKKQMSAYSKVVKP